MMFDMKTVLHIATLTKQEVANLPRIHIPNEGILFQLMAWRDKHKDEVRNFLPFVAEGTISVLTQENFQYFKVIGRDVFHMNVTSDTQHIAFSMSLDTGAVTPISNTIEFYKGEDAIQDMITVHATAMAYLESIGIRNIDKNEVFVISEVTE